MLAPIQSLLRKATLPGNRRGTVLLLVLGSLALVLILAVVYAALGKGDRRTARTTQERKSAVDNINDIGDYIAGVFATDVFNVVPEVTDSGALNDIYGTNTPIMRRENIDIPVTDYFFTSVPSELAGVGNNQNLIDYMRFYPDGGHSADVVWDELSSDVSDLNIFNIDPRTASDPFLASTRPVDLGGNNLSLDTPPYLRALDWAQISNFSPDGRFVNLFYLRDNFGAPPLDLTRDPSSGDARLSLFDSDGNPTTDLPFSDIPTSSGTVSTEPADWNKPMHWTMFQRRLFRPINDPAFVGTDMARPESEDYWAYQYADADGDGILDSRWFEMVDSTKPSQPVALLGESDMRFFVAARAIDLSSLVNVATATDFLAPSTTGYRVGSGPEDINLFKLLNFSEHVRVNALPNDTEINYADAFETNTGTIGDYGLFELQASQGIGRKSYLRLSDGRNQGYIRPFGEVPAIAADGTYGLEANPDVGLSEDIRDYTLFTTPASRVDYTTAVGSVYPGSSAGGNSRTAPYGVDDLVELLTFHGINDDRNFSKLEQAFSAVNTPSIEGANVLSSFSQLRSDRKTIQEAWVPAGEDEFDLKLMRSAVDIRRMLTTVSGSRPLRSSILDLEGYSKLTENLDRKLILDTLVLGSGEYPSNEDSTTTIDNVREEQSRLIGNAFGVYLSMLAPDLRADDWDQLDIDRYNRTKTQYYGHMGPELAVRIAGHMALNFRDMADAPFVDGILSTPATADGIPDVASVLDLDLSNPTELDAYNRRVDEPSVAVMRLATNWDPINTPNPNGIMDQLWEAGLKLDIDDIYNGDPGDFIAADAQNVSHAAMILYGNEPQPFLSQVSSMTMYMDVPRGGDDQLPGIPDGVGEWNFQPPTGGTGNEIYDGLPSIDGNADDASNPDFLFQAIYFQIFNPFDVPIVLDHYYFEFADSFYSVTDGAATSSPVILQPRSTMVLWATNPGDSQAVADRLQAQFGLLPVSSADPRATNAFEAMVYEQLGTEVDAQPLRKRYSQDPGSVSVSGTYNEIDPIVVQDLFHEDPSNKSDANRVVMLWRDNPSVSDPTLGRIDWSQNRLTNADRSTDQLVDRLRDSSDFSARSASAGASTVRSALDRRLDLDTRVTRTLGYTVNDAIRGDAARRGVSDPFNPADFALSYTNYNYNMQLGVALWGSISRRDDFSYESANTATEYYTDNLAATPAQPNHQGRFYVTGTPVGALPGKVFEPVSNSSAGSYQPFAGSNLLEHDVGVAGDGTSAFPEDLGLRDDFASDSAATIDASPNPGVTHVIARDLWRALQDGTVEPEFFASLGAPVFERGTSIGLSTSMPANTNTAIGDYEAENYIKVTVNQTEFRDLLTGRRTLRVGDMLLPLAVGAYRTPLEPGVTAPATPNGQYSENVAQRLEQYEAQWTTLGEALAAASGYSDSVGPGGGVASLGPRDPFESLAYDHEAGFPQPKLAQAAAAGGITIPAYVLDRGQLRLDAFVPFIDMDTNGLFAENTDIRRGLGIPMALNLFDIAQAGTDNGIAALGGINRPVMGTINANTAEPEVLRLHPALAMDMFDASGATPVNRLWWPRTLYQLTENSQAFRLNLFEDKSPETRPVPFADVGSMITSYRDPARYTRLDIGGGLAGTGGPLTEVVNFPRQVRVVGRPEFGLGIDRDKADIENIRPLPGFGSIGELFAVRDPSVDDVQHQVGGFARDTRSLGVGFIDRTGNADTNPNYGQGIDFYNTLTSTTALPKINQLRSGEIQIATFGNQLTGDQIGLAANYGAVPTTEALKAFPAYPGDGSPNSESRLLPIMPDQIPDSYDEQLVQLNAVLNSMSVRSDYFAVWFVVHGYKESDTQGLQPTDPLSPSFQARYLMILDRSNVTQKGDRPKVLAFVQLPMLPDPSTGTN